MQSTPPQFDPNIIERYADQLYRKADSLRIGSAVIGAVLGIVFGAVPLSPLGKYLPVPTTFGLATVLLGALCGGFIGYVVGEGRAFRTRLQAQMVLFQLQLERNTASAQAPAAPVAAPVPAQAPVPAPQPAEPVFVAAAPPPPPPAYVPPAPVAHPIEAVQAIPVLPPRPAVSAVAAPSRPEQQIPVAQPAAEAFPLLAPRPSLEAVPPQPEEPMLRPLEQVLPPVRRPVDDLALPPVSP